MKFICPLVVVEDIQRSRFLYESILGQKVKADFGENLTFEGDYALHQKAHFQQLIDNKPIIPRSNSFELCFEEDDLIALELKLIHEGFEFVHRIKEQPWRQQVMRFYDYDGNIIEVGESMEHVAFRLSNEGLEVQEISKITYLPSEIVNEAIDKYRNKRR